MNGACNVCLANKNTLGGLAEEVLPVMLCIGSYLWYDHCVGQLRSMVILLPATAFNKRSNCMRAKRTVMPGSPFHGWYNSATTLF
jgi:hypothetical protein